MKKLTNLFIFFLITFTVPSKDISIQSNLISKGNNLLLRITLTNDSPTERFFLSLTDWFYEVCDGCNSSYPADNQNNSLVSICFYSDTCEKVSMREMSELQDYSSDTLPYIIQIAPTEKITINVYFGKNEKLKFKDSTYNLDIGLSICNEGSLQKIGGDLKCDFVKLAEKKSLVNISLVQPVDLNRYNSNLFLKGCNFDKEKSKILRSGFMERINHNTKVKITG